jgi:serine carboxypeptidase-like clade 1
MLPTMTTKRPFLLLLLLLLTTALLASAQQPQPNIEEEAAADRITYLPGYPHELPSRHYAGYIRVDGDDEGDAAAGDADGSGVERHRHPQNPARNLFYYMAESERDPLNDPVVLWLNGGPGCSSFDAFVYEHGPFLFSASSPDGISNGELPLLKPNPFSWSKVATMIYLDSPANVGLSFVDPTEHEGATNAIYRTNDTHTASDADAFLRGFFKRHSRLLDKPFYITGESYAGIYVPNLARQVMRNNAAGVEPTIDLRGYAVGNGCTDAQYDGNALPPFLAGRGLMPQDDFLKLQQACNGSFWDAEGFEWARAFGAGAKGSSNSGGRGGTTNENRAAVCGKALEKAVDVALDGINIYDTLDLCHASHRPREEEEQGGGASRFRSAAARAAATTTTQRLPPWARVAALSLPAGRFDVAPQARVAALQPGARVAAAVAAVGDAAAAPSAPAGAPAPPPHPPTPPPLSHNPPCTSATLAEDWLNNPSVRRALHAAPIEADDDDGDGADPSWVAGRWTLCSDRLHYTHDAGSMLPVHAELLPGLPGWPKMLAQAGLREEAERAWARRAGAKAAAAGLGVGGVEASSAPPRLRALIYTGDHDAAVPSTGSEAWTTDIGGGKPLPGKQWRAWRVRQGTDGGGRPAGGEDAAAGLEQVGGYTREFPGGLTYATIRGAGHMVPTSKPLEALELFRRFVDGEELAAPLKEQEANDGDEEGEEGEEERKEDPLDGGDGAGGGDGAAPAAPPTTFTVRL